MLKEFIALNLIVGSLVSVIPQSVNIQGTEEITISMVGDDLIHSPLYKSADNGDGTYDFSNQFENIKDIIATDDIAIINQETIFVSDNSKISSYPCFGSPTDLADDIVNAGFDVVCHATNHTMDKGIQGIEDTVNYWRNNHSDTIVLGIHSSENEKDYYIRTVKGVNIGFVNYTYGLNGIPRKEEYLVDMLEDSDIPETMSEVSSNSDFVIAILHIGDEYRYTPTDYQKNTVNLFVDMGADLVICAHPHVIESYEEITTESGNKGVVFYSLGNFISSQDKIERCVGGMAKVKLSIKDNNGKKEVTCSSYSMIPLFTHQQSGYYTTYLLEDYTDEMFKKHRLYGNGYYSVEDIKAFYNSIVK